MSPVQNSFSVPVEMPEWSIRTTTSRGPGAVSATVARAIWPGAESRMASVCKRGAPGLSGPTIAPGDVDS